MYPERMDMSELRHLGIAEARANLTELAAEVRLLGQPVVLTRRDKPQVAVVPLDMLRRILASEPKPAES